MPFLEMDVDFENGMNPVKTINSVMMKLDQYTEIPTILLLDEVIPSTWNSDPSKRDVFDLTQLQISKSNSKVHLLMAINPVPRCRGFDKKMKILSPKHFNTLTYQLFMRHRNCYEIAILLEHFIFFCEQGCLDSSQDIQLNKALLPPGRCPVWIERGRWVSDEEVLELIKRDYVFEYESVTVLHFGCHVGGNISSWCEQNNWKCIEMNEMYGCEDQVIVIFDVKGLRPEHISRAKNGLIILTTHR